MKHRIKLSVIVDLETTRRTDLTRSQIDTVVDKVAEALAGSASGGDLLGHINKQKSPATGVVYINEGEYGAAFDDVGYVHAIQQVDPAGQLKPQAKG